MNNSSMSMSEGGNVTVATTTTVDGGGSGGDGAGGGGGGGGGGGRGSVDRGGILFRDFSSYCRNLSLANSGVYGTPAGNATRAVDDTDFGAVLYIVVVLTFYSFGIVVMIVKYLKTEKKEMEEEMVLDSFFKGIPDKRIENEKQAVNRVAIQAFHTLTTSKQPRGQPQSSQDPNPKRHTTAAAAMQHKNLLSPTSYRRERYSIQPMYIGASRQLDDDDLSDVEDIHWDYEINSKGEKLVSTSNEMNENGNKRKHWTSEYDDEVKSFDQRGDSVNAKSESKPQKSVIFSDTVESTGVKGKCDFKENGGARSKKKGLNSKTSPPLSQSSTNGSLDVSNSNECSVTVTDVHSPLNKSTTKDNSSDAEFDIANSSSQTADVTCASNTQNSPLENDPLNVLSTPQNKPTRNAGKGILSARKTSKGVMMMRPQNSLDLGSDRNLFRMSSLDKGVGDGCSYDSSSSLLTRIHLAETFTPPLRSKNLQHTRVGLQYTKPSSSGECLSHFRDDNGVNSSSKVKYPSNDDVENGAVEGKSNDEKLKLTAGKSLLSSMQPSYESTASSRGLTTRVNIVDSSAGADGGSLGCLVTDL